MNPSFAEKAKSIFRYMSGADLHERREREFKEIRTEEGGSDEGYSDDLKTEGRILKRYLAHLVRRDLVDALIITGRLMGINPLARQLSRFVKRPQNMS